MDSSKLLQRAAVIVAGLATAGAAAAHPGHSHEGWLAEVAHVIHAVGPLLAVLAIGIGATVTYLALDRER